MLLARVDSATVEFLKRQLAALNEALAPLPPVDYNAEFAKQLAARKTSLTVTYTDGEPRE
jgi:hypothetical protein